MVKVEYVVDLHSHTTCSDGELAPKNLVTLAAENGIRALAITDHDTVEAYEDFNLYEKAQNLGVRLVEGVEISTQDELGRMHVLGLDIDAHHTGLKHWLNTLRLGRTAYSEAMSRLFTDDGWAVDDAAMSKSHIHTKASIADAIALHAANAGRLMEMFGGRLPSRGEFIEKLMNKGGQYYIPRPVPTPKEAIEHIHEAGGVAVLAHPVAYMYEQGLTMEDLATTVERYPFDGLEAVYYYFYKSGGDVEVDKVKEFIDFAKQYELIVTGGSDYHGQSEQIGRHMDMGFTGKNIVPTLAMLNKVQACARRIPEEKA